MRERRLVLVKDNLGYYDVYPYKKDEERQKGIDDIVEKITELISDAENMNALDEVLEQTGLQKVIDDLDLEDNR